MQVTGFKMQPFKNTCGVYKMPLYFKEVKVSLTNKRIHRNFIGSTYVGQT